MQNDILNNCNINQAESVSTVALISDSELLSIFIKTTFDINNAENYVLNLVVCKQKIL